MTMENGDKVYGGLTMTRQGQVRTIVVAKSQKAAASLMGMSLHEFRNYWTETGNVVELEVARRTTGKVFKATSSGGVDFRRTEP